MCALCGQWLFYAAQRAAALIAQTDQRALHFRQT
jgi:hypothetical protein